MTLLLGEGFALGLATGLYCLGACAPLLAPYLLCESEGAFGRGARLLLEFMAGRLAAYLLFAAAASKLGARYPGLAGGRVVAAGLLLSGLLMVLYAVVRSAPRLSVCAPWADSAAVRRLPFAFGFLVGINVCPPFAAGLLRLVSLASPAKGMVYFAAFFVGTTVYMLPFLVAAPLSRGPRLRSAAALASGLAGLWFAGLGLYRLL
ncbi:MAG: sulfite exporter TauE/SafE family protein [Elusimicrobia bacterium]|nr:sulfite exporter TauE/SafE family protein [Elusimicrobiota bacterium]